MSDDVMDREQYRCGACGQFSKPAPIGEEPEPGMTGYVEGCWVRTGFLCPDCEEGE